MNYVSVRQTMYNNDIGIYHTYGIKTNDGRYAVADVGTDKEFVEAIVKILNQYAADPLHMTDVIENMLV